MPLIRMANIPLAEGGPNTQTVVVQSVAQALIDGCLAANVPFITKRRHVTVVNGGIQIFDEDKTLVVFVEGLFERPERTNKMRVHLAKKLAECAMKTLPNGWKVEVLIGRFNPNTDTFYELPQPKASRFSPNKRSRR